MARFSGASGSGSGGPGPRGPQGPEGDSAYEVAVENGFVGTEQEWLDSLGGNGTADIADFIFASGEGQSTISLPGDKQMRIESGAESDLYLDAGDDLYLTTIEDDIHIRAGDDIRFTSSYDGDEGTEYYWRMNSEGRFQLPGDGYISNPYQETSTPGTYTTSFNDNYLNDQSGLNQTYSVALPVDGNTLWFANNGSIFTSPVTITFADSTTTTTVAIYDATSQGTPAVIFQWDDEQRSKSYADTFPLLIAVDYNQINSGPSVIILDPVEWYDSDQHIVIDATAPNHIHIRAGGEIDQSTADLFLGGEDTNVKVSDSYGTVNINAADITISSQAAPSALNINTYTGAIINSARTSEYAPEDKIVATLGDLIPGIQGEPGPAGADGADGADAPTNRIYAGDFEAIIDETGTTTFDGNIVPSAATYSLGTAALPWQDIYVSAGSINIADADMETDSVSIKNTEGYLVLSRGGLKVTDNTNEFEVFQLNPDGTLTLKSNVTEGITTAALEVIGSLNGTSIDPGNTGVLLHLTGLRDSPSRIYNDSYGTGVYSAYIGRHARGTSEDPEGLIAGDVISRIGGNAFLSSGQFAPISNVRMDFVAKENQTATARGNEIQFWTTPNGATSPTRSFTLENTGITFPDNTKQTTAYKGTSAFGGYYGSFYDTTNLLLTSATTAYPLPIGATAEANGVSIALGSRITVANAGVYNIQFSAQLDKTDSSDDLVNIWFSKNGTNIANSNTQVTVMGNGGKYLASWNYVLTLAANDYIQIMLQSPDTHMRVIASGTQTNPARPAVPSSIVTVTQVA